jgi:hypothetical protein
MMRFQPPAVRPRFSEPLLKFRGMLNCNRDHCYGYFGAISLLALATACSAAPRPIAVTPAADASASLVAEAQAFMDAYARALRDSDRADLAARYHPDGVYRMGEGRKRLLTPDAVHAIYHGPWQPPNSFEWRDLSYEVVGPDAVAVMGLFLWGEDAGRQLLYSYTGLLLRRDGGLYIRVEDESPAAAPTSTAPDSIREALLLVDAAVSAGIERRDRVALDTLYADDFVWRHWDGSTVTKASWLAFLDSVDYQRHRSSVQEIEVFGGTAAAVSGTLESRGRYLDADSDFAYAIRYIRIYLFDEQTRRWLLQQQYSRRQE